MIKDIQKLQNTLNKMMKSNDLQLKKALNDLAKVDPERAKEFEKLTTSIKKAETQEEAQNKIQELIAKCQ